MYNLISLIVGVLLLNKYLVIILHQSNNNSLAHIIFDAIVFDVYFYRDIHGSLRGSF